MKLPALALAASLSATAFVVTAPGGAATAAPAAVAAVSSVDWGRCSDPTLRGFGARCGFVKVPLDYSRPGGRQIRLAVSRITHTVRPSRYQGALLLNPGGPGGSGLTMSVLGPIISLDFGRPDVGRAYDWIGFDPRGVGASRPSLSCDPRYFGPDRPEYVPSTPHLFHVWQRRSRRYAADCGKAGGRLLDHMRTTDSARDMDQIRAALGVDRISYYGFSYGTYLGQVYATLFPQRVRRMVLDSNVDPRKVWYRANLEQDLAFQRNIGIFFGWVARHDATYHLGATRGAVEARYKTVHAQLADTPINGVVGPDEWDDVFLYAGYADFLWPRLAGVFAGWVGQGAGDDVVAAYQDFDTPGDDNSYAVYNAVSCVDDTWKDEAFLQDQWSTYYAAPFLTWGNAWFNGPCYHWPARAHARTRVDGAALGSALLVDETRDAATPYSGSRYLRSIAPLSRLVAVVGGTNHAVTPSGNACTDNRIFRYLATGKLPARKAGAGPDVRCRKLPAPRPGGAEAFAGPGGSSSTLSFARAAQAGDAGAGRALLSALLLQAARP
ncbi:MAG: alpha/beta fold hydrolase [Sporichthyaceae bacterium]